MRAGVCAAQQTLSVEAASVLKHSLSLARRRGHAQVTPLHVAATLLSSRASPLRRACLKSQPNQHSHPLQCRALELCFNVALNRLPATPTPLLHSQPSLSNALVAALKRAQANQRRGCIEQQQQSPPPLIGVKVELEQLIWSILDDPSVSRVMREAGFSSTAVKNNMEESTNSVSVFECYNNSAGIYSTPSSPPNNDQNPNSFWHSNLMSYVSEQNPLIFSPQKGILNKPVANTSSLNEDIKLVLEVLLRKKRRNTVIVGDSFSMNEALVAELMNKVKRGDVAEELKSVYFVKFQFSSVPLQFMKREEVDMHIDDLKRKVESFASNGRVIIYTGDLKWTVEQVFCAGKESKVYSPIDHLVSEIAKLLSWYNNDSLNTKVWLMATASYQTYMKCQMKQPPLDVQWSLQAVFVPSGGLGLSLNATATIGVDSRITFNENLPNVIYKRPFFGKEEEQDVLNCCPECTSNYEKEASQHHDSFSLNKKTENDSVQLPYWLKPQGIETSEKEDLVKLRRKYNSHCQNLHRGSQNPNSSSANFMNQRFLGRNHFNTSSYPCWKNMNIFGDSDTISFGYSSVKPNQIASSLPRFRRQQSCHIEFSFENGNSKYQSTKPNLDSLKSMDDKEVKITLALGNSMFAAAPNTETIKLNAEMCKTLQENFPWKMEIIPLILQALMDPKGFDQDKWLLIQGDDFIGKRRLAIGIAKSMLGSSDLFFCMNMRENKRTVIQDCEMLHKALKDNEKIAVLVEDVDCADPEFVKFLDDGFESRDMGKLMKIRRDSGNTIMILTTNESLSFNKKIDITDSVIQMKIVVGESKLGSGVVSVLDHKRKSDWDSPVRIKSRRNSEIEEIFSNELDLNVKVDEDEQREGKAGDLSPISSDLTREITLNQRNSPKFLEKIKNRFVFNRSMDQENHAKDMFLAMFERHFEEVCGGRNISSFNVDEMVLEEVFQRSGFYLNNLFEQWLKDVFQRSLHMVNTGGRGNISVRLCLGGKGEYCSDDGFMGTSLPNGIQVSFIG